MNHSLTNDFIFYSNRTVSLADKNAKGPVLLFLVLLRLLLFDLIRNGLAIDECLAEDLENEFPDPATSVIAGRVLSTFLIEDERNKDDKDGDNLSNE